ncbi:hypothetical protein HAX54_013330 [Datura stramonium]|uniref:Uncharacterized protein n=1 Tax=Datura stramonium TaxID=4076 RepID=A0ABS8RJA0_DATST|nr:hypothetical protein [Datura stramonium]
MGTISGLNRSILLDDRVHLHMRLDTSGCYKCNVDGASKGNPGSSSIAFCVRNDIGNLIDTKASVIEEGYNLSVEAKPMVAGVISDVTRRVWLQVGVSPKVSVEQWY